MFAIVACPQCHRPAEILDRFVLESTDGPVEHLRVSCVDRHHFMLPAEAMSRWTAPASRAA